MKYTQPSLMNVDEFAPHVDDLDPGTLTREQWRARSDVYHHSGEQREWNTNFKGDPAVHVGSKEQADFRGGQYEHRLRVPKDRLTSKTLTDVGANALHVSAAQRAGAEVSKGVMDSLDVGYDEPRRYKLHDGREVRAEPTTVDDDDAFDRGWAFPYVNTGEDVRKEYPGAPSNRATYGTSIVSPQQTIRTWAQDVDTAAERNPPEVRKATGEGPSSGVLQQRQFFGNVADHSEEHGRYNRDQSMEPFANYYRMPNLPHPETVAADDTPDHTIAHINQRNWHRTGKGWEVQSPGLL